MDRKKLTDLVVAKIESYLAGKVSKAQVSRWATRKLLDETFSAQDTLLEDALTALAGLHDDDERFDTADEDLVYLRDCLLGQAPHVTTIEYPARLAQQRSGT